METGKKTCEKLKDLRKQVAEANGIEYEPAECTYEGDCPGTCPRCDAELADLQRQLDEKEARGEKIVYKDETTTISALTGEVPKDLKGHWTEFVYGGETISICITEAAEEEEEQKIEYCYPEMRYSLIGDITTVDIGNTMGNIISKDELPEGEDETAKGELLSDIDIEIADLSQPEFEFLSDIDYLTDNYEHFDKEDKGEKDKDGKDTLELV